MLKKTLSSVVCIAMLKFSMAQKTDYTTLQVAIPVAATLTQFADYKTFDVTVLTTKEVQDKPGTGFNLDFQPKIGSLTQVANDGDFHVVSVLQRYGGKMTSKTTADVTIYVTSTVYDKYGAVANSAILNNEHLAVNLDKEPSKEESGNADFMRKIIFEKALTASLAPFNDGLFGGQKNFDVRIASLDDVKKKPELQDFDAQIKILKPALQSNKLAGFKTAAQPYISYWEKMSSYGTDEDANEVKRAALHNLALYNIADGNFEKAKTYIELYKPIDKQIKQMFGLIKYKNSEELEKLITLLAPAATNVIANNNGATILTKTQVADLHQFLTVKGTAKISGKKIEGTYNGIIKVNKLPVNSFGNIVNLDPENIVVTIAYDEAGQSKTINTTVSHIDELKDEKGSSYTSQKFGTAMLGEGSYYVFMKSTYSSPKVTVYRAIIPASNDYVIKKAGDDKGVKSSLLNARKNLEDYLSDCEVLKAKFKSDTIDKKASVEKIAEEYTNCN